MLQTYTISFSIGFLGSLHCIGMCGGLVSALSLSRPRPWWPGLLAYQAGRLLTYSLLGLMVGLFGLSLQQLGSISLLQNGLAALAGLMMLSMGLNLAGMIPDPFARLALRITKGSALARRFSHAARHSTLPAWLAAGMANGLLPCGLVYAALSLALAHSDLWGSASLMAAFGLGTVPAMLLAPVLVSSLSAVKRGRAMKLVGMLLIALGLLTMFRGSDWMQHAHTSADLPQSQHQMHEMNSNAHP